MHGVPEPVRKNQQEQAEDAESLGLKVVDLRQDTVGRVSERALGGRGSE